MNMMIYLDDPNIGEIEKDALTKVLDSGFVSTIGPFVQRFEERFVKYLGTEDAVSTQSGTAAIHISLHELGVGRGDEVIVPALTFIATVNPVIYAGATPVFVDVDKQTWNMIPDLVEAAVTEKTKAIIPVHLYGNPCDMKSIREIADKHGLYIIEDATESLGASYRGKFTGSFGDMGCFSFNGNKIITTGGGGMVIGKDSSRMNHVRYLVNQARDKSESIYHSEVGFNYRMTNIEAALGIAQFSRIDDFLSKKRRFHQIYKEELSDVNGISFQNEYEGGESSWWFTCIYLEDNILIPDFQKKLKERGIPTRRIFTPINEFPPYKGCRFISNQNSENIYEHGLCLPASTLNSDDQIYYVSKVIKELV